MGKKNDTGTTTKTTSKAAAPPKVKTYKRLGDALAAFDNGETPRGTKLTIAAAGTVIAAPAKKGEPPVELYRFNGTPSQFASAVLKQVVKTKLRIDVNEHASALAALNPPSDSSEE